MTINMFNITRVVFASTTLLLLVQCKSATIAIDDVHQTKTTESQMELRNPVFADTEVVFYKWVKGVEAGDSGITMTFLWNELPNNIVMKEAYFRDLITPIKLNQKGYKAFFKYGEKTPQDIIMHSDPLQEIGNTPPVHEKHFPVALTDQQVGIIYEDNGQIAYTIIGNLIEQPQASFPNMQPHLGHDH